MPGGERRENGDGDEFIRAQLAAPEIGQRGQDDRIAQEHGANHAADVSDGGAELEPLDDERVDDKEQAGQRLLQANGGVAVIVTTAPARLIMVVVVFFVAEEGGDLHA